MKTIRIKLAEIICPIKFKVVEIPVQLEMPKIIES